SAAAAGRKTRFMRKCLLSTVEPAEVLRPAGSPNRSLFGGGWAATALLLERSIGRIPLKLAETPSREPPQSSDHGVGEPLVPPRAPSLPPFPLGQLALGPAKVLSPWKPLLVSLPPGKARLRRRNASALLAEQLEFFELRACHAAGVAARR